MEATVKYVNQRHLYQSGKIVFTLVRNAARATGDTVVSPPIQQNGQFIFFLYFFLFGSRGGRDVLKNGAGRVQFPE